MCKRKSSWMVVNGESSCGLVCVTERNGKMFLLFLPQYYHQADQGERYLNFGEKKTKEVKWMCTFIFLCTTNSKNFNVIQFEYGSHVNASDLFNATHSFQWHICHECRALFFLRRLHFHSHFCSVRTNKCKVNMKHWLLPVFYQSHLKCEIRTIADIKTMNLFLSWHWIAHFVWSSHSHCSKRANALHFQLQLHYERRYIAHVCTTSRRISSECHEIQSIKTKGSD